MASEAWRFVRDLRNLRRRLVGVLAYDRERAYDLARRVDVAVHKLADEVRCDANDGDHGDETEAAGDEEGFGQRR